MNADKGLPAEKPGGNESFPNLYAVPESIGWRWLIGFVTIVLPALSFTIVIFEPYFLKPEWQSGRVSDYVELMLTGPVTIFYYPFLIYAMVSMGLLLSKPDKYERHFPIRVGIYTGVILSLQYSLLVLLSKYDWVVLSVTVVWVFLTLGIGWLIRYIKSKWPNGVKWLTVVIGLFIGIRFLIDPDIRFNIYILVYTPLPAGPLASLIVSAWVSAKLIKIYGFIPTINGWRKIGGLAWFLAYIAVWRLAMVKTLELYAELPPTPPAECYIATAAARGHPALVKSSPVRLPSGEMMRVNPQLRYLKCGEIGLRTLWPRLHGGLRTIYDRFGRRLAERISHPLLADLAYLSLKPVEWGTKLWLRMLIPNIDEIAERVYPDVYLPGYPD